jgi:hypothetical protein
VRRGRRLCYSARHAEIRDVAIPLVDHIINSVSVVVAAKESAQSECAVEFGTEFGASHDDCEFDVVRDQVGSFAMICGI